MATTLDHRTLAQIDAYWCTANYLSVGQIHLLDNPLLKEPLRREHMKPRLVGHWGTPLGLNFLYVHLNRVIKKDDLNVIYVIGPGHGGPALVSRAYLEGTHSEVYRDISQDQEGIAGTTTLRRGPGPRELRAINASRLRKKKDFPQPAPSL